MILKQQRPIEIINDCGCCVDERMLAEAILWFADRPVFRVKHIYMHGRYPAVSIQKYKIHIHRLLMMYKHNREIEKHECVHHIDGNPLNASIDNLMFIDKSSHSRLHHKGKTLSEERCRMISENNRKRRGIRHCMTRPDVTYAQVYKMRKAGCSINKIAKHFNTDWSTVKNRLNDIHDNPELLEVS